jgi:chromosome segregation ATPase
MHAGERQMAESFERALGELQGSLRFIAESVKSNAADSSASRKQLYERIEDVNRGIQSIETRLDKAEATLREMQPITADIKKWKERAIGAGMFIGLCAAFIGGTLATYWTKLVSVFKGWV